MQLSFRSRARRRPPVQAGHTIYLTDRVPPASAQHAGAAFLVGMDAQGEVRIYRSITASAVAMTLHEIADQIIGEVARGRVR